MTQSSPKAVLLGYGKWGRTLHEEIIRGTVVSLMTYFIKKPAKGECVILVGKDNPHVYFDWSES